jgi:hypothetical protein
MTLSEVWRESVEDGQHADALTLVEIEYCHKPQTAKRWDLGRKEAPPPNVSFVRRRFVRAPYS